MLRESSLPSGNASLLDSSMVSSWFALRAAVLRLAVSWLWTLAFKESRAVVTALVHRQNSSMHSLLVARPVASVGTRARQYPWPPRHIAAGPAVRANPSLKPTCLRHAA